MIKIIFKLFSLVSLVALLAFNVVPLVALAQSPAQNFGGLVLTPIFCTCSGNWWIAVGPPKPGFFTYNWTPQYANFMLPAAGVWTLGLYVPPIPCMMWYGLFCAPLPAPLMGSISPIVGTSF